MGRKRYSFSSGEMQRIGLQWKQVYNRNTVQADIIGIER
jgi:hypothetical protein